MKPGLMIFVVAMGVLLARPLRVCAVDPADLPKAIESAKTAADHEALAAYYEGEAKTARAAAARHQAMSNAYERRPEPGGTKGLRTSLNRTMPRHCDALVSSYDAAAKQYGEMAAEHRRTAQELE